MNPRCRLLTSIASLTLFLTLVCCAPAQETVPLEEAQKIARKLVALVTDVSDLPFAVVSDTERPTALKGGEAGVLLLPDTHLSAESVAAAAQTYVPLGQLWAHKVALVTGGNGFPSDRLRTLTVGQGDQSRQVQLFYLGIVKNAQGDLELGVFGKGHEPLCRVALRKTGPEKQEFPVELSGEKTGEESARLTLNVAGGYSAALDFIKAD